MSTDGQSLAAQLDRLQMAGAVRVFRETASGAKAERCAAFLLLGDAWPDTATPHDRLMLTVPAGLAEFEREPIRARTGGGRTKAKAEGRRIGRPHKPKPHQRREASERKAGEGRSSIARSFNVHHATIGCLQGSS